MLALDLEWVENDRPAPEIPFHPYVGLCAEELVLPRKRRMDTGEPKPQVAPSPYLWMQGSSIWTLLPIRFPRVLQIGWSLSSANTYYFQLNILSGKQGAQRSSSTAQPWTAEPPRHASIRHFCQVQEDVCFLWRGLSEVSGCTQRFNRNFKC